MRPFQTCFAHPSGMRRLRGWVIAFFLCVVLGGGLGPAPAQAIPMAGDYVFVSGDPNISGSFRSTGSLVSNWSFSSNLGILGGSTISWSSETDGNPGGNVNTDVRFITNNSSDPRDPFGYYAQLQWKPDPSITNAVFRVDATCCDIVYTPGPPTVSFVPAPSVSVSIPDSATVVFLGVGLLGLAVYQWRQQRQGRL